MHRRSFTSRAFLGRLNMKILLVAGILELEILSHEKTVFSANEQNSQLQQWVNPWFQKQEATSRTLS